MLPEFPALLILIAVAILAPIVLFVYGPSSFIIYLAEIAGGLVAFAGIYLVLIYESRRDLAFKNIDQVFKPCYAEIVELIESIKRYEPFTGTSGWSKLQKDANGKFLSSSNPTLFKALIDLYDKLSAHNQLLITNPIEYPWKEAFDKEIKKTVDMPDKSTERLDGLVSSYRGALLRGFLDDRSFDSIAKEQLTTGDEMLKRINQPLKTINDVYINQFVFTREFFDEVHKSMQNDERVKVIRASQAEVIKKAESVQRLLETEITGPHLFRWIP